MCFPNKIEKKKMIWEDYVDGDDDGLVVFTTREWNELWFYFQPTEEAVDTNLDISVTMKVCDDTPNARCIVSLKILFQNDVMIIEKGRNGNVKLNGETLQLPFSNDQFYVKKVTSLFKLIRGFGFYIMYDGDQRIYLNLGPFYMNKVSFTS